jgi:hypothetical protein
VSARLRELVDAGILEKHPYREPGSRTRFEYHLTDRGHDLMPVVLALWQWGDKHLQNGRPPLRVVDPEGRLVTVAVVSADNTTLTADDLHVRRPDSAEREGVAVSGRRPADRP